ncbi:MAG: AMP-binding protein [Leptolyngbya sp. SIO3F4]|nr:AMP-binding protein [Leptolyngbya sp. SIO3F4]
MSFSNINGPKSLLSVKSYQALEPKRPWALQQIHTNQTDFPESACIHRLFEQQVQETPQSIAINFDNTQVTYQQLNRQSNRLAYQLSTLGIEPGHSVGICVEPSLDMVIGLLGILKAGGVYVPITPNVPRKHVTHIFQDTQPKVLLTQTYLEHNLEAFLSHQDINLICLDRDQWKNMQSCPDLGVHVTANSLGYIIYPNSSTDQSNIAMMSHNTICNQLYWRQHIFPLNKTDSVLQDVSFDFVPSVWQIFWPLLSGAQVILPHSHLYQDLDYLVNLITQAGVSAIDLPLDLLRDLLEHPQLENSKTLQQIFCGDEPLPLDLKQKFLQQFTTPSV